MKLKQILGVFSFAALAITLQSFGKKPVYYFVIDSDTTFCKTLNYQTNKQGQLVTLEYMDTKGKQTVVEGKDHCPEVETFHLNGLTYDRIPLKVDDKDKKNYRYTERVVDGKVRVYLAQKGQSDNPAGGGNASSFYLFYLKTHDGKYYKIDDEKQMTNNIKPYMLECAAFKKEYKGGFNSKEAAFIETAKLYNSLCQ